MIVRGDSVTRKQANEILIRTAHRSYFDQCNDKAWGESVRLAFGVKDPHSFAEFSDRLNALTFNNEVMDKLGVLELEYMHNSQIASAYINGPHGWLNWEGNISGNTGYGIGKWPEESELLAEWAMIAAAFPFLKLQAQFLSEGTYNDPNSGGELILEITVKDGEAHITNGRLFEAEDFALPTVNLDFLYRSVSAERGVSAARLAEALADVRGNIAQ